jgi:predicted transcriptional regulator
MTKGHRLPTLKARRLAAGYSVTRLAQIANVSDLTINQLENGGNCDADVTERILAA